MDHEKQFQIFTRFFLENLRKFFKLVIKETALTSFIFDKSSYITSDDIRQREIKKKHSLLSHFHLKEFLSKKRITIKINKYLSFVKLSNTKQTNRDCKSTKLEKGNDCMRNLQIIVAKLKKDGEE
jgi:hypothetical protein